MEINNLLKVGITLGDINGIGPEVVLKTMMDNRMPSVCTSIVYGSSKVASYHRKNLNLGEFTFHMIRTPEQANVKQANMINCWEEEVKVEMGVSTELGGQKAFQALQKAVEDLKAGKLNALVTAPINKKNIQNPNFKFPGHTEYLAEQFQVKDYLMLLVNNGLRVGTVTGHIPLQKVSSELSIEKILSKIKVMNKSLKEDFAIRKPIIAVLGLNPHNGDEGLIGNEENTIILPAIQKAKDEGILAMGPYSADGFFGSGNYAKFDGILAMYHDQGLIPFKALSFHSGVNFTAGLPVIRTSPDHGVGYDIAGKNIASEQSLRDAVYLAIDIYNNRKEYKEINAHPLPIKERERRTNQIE